MVERYPSTLPSSPSCDSCVSSIEKSHVADNTQVDTQPKPRNTDMMKKEEEVRKKAEESRKAEEKILGLMKACWPTPTPLVSSWVSSSFRTVDEHWGECLRGFSML